MMFLKSIVKLLCPTWALGLSWYTPDDMNTAIIPKIEKYQVPVLFKNRGYLLELLWNKAKVAEKETHFEVPLQHKSGSHSQGLTSALGELTGSHDALLTKGYDDLVTLGDLAIFTRGELDNKSVGDRVIVSMVNTRIKGMLDGIANDINASLWRRTAAVPGSKTGNLKMNGMYDIYATRSAASSFHNISPSTYTIWRPYNYVLADLSIDASSRAKIKSDSDADAFILTLLDREIGYFTSRNVAPADAHIQVGSSLFNIICATAEAQDKRVPDGKFAAKMGYTSINRKGYDVVEDDTMSTNQSDNTDGWIAGVCHKDLDLYVGDARKISVGPIVGGMKQIYQGSQILCDIQLCAHALNTHVFMYNVFNEKAFIPSSQE
jgi:hypothetical protein